MHEADKCDTVIASADTHISANFFLHPVVLIVQAKMVHTSHLMTGSDEPTASEQTSNEANISHHSAQTRPTSELHPTSTSSSQSARLFTPTTHNTAFARLRFRRGPHLFPQHSGSAQLHLPTSGLLLLPLAMAHLGQTYIKKTNKRGDVFFDYGGTPDQLTAELCFPSDDSDDNEHGGVSLDREDGLSEQFAGLRFGNADDGNRDRRPHRHSEQNSTSRTARNVQWEMDNLPIDGTRPPREHLNSTFHHGSNLQWEADNLPSEATRSPADEEPADESIPYNGGLSDEHTALIALERAYNALVLPIEDDISGENKNYMVQLAVQFIFRTLPWLNYIRGDLETLGDLYDESSLAKKFYSKYGVAVWGFDGGGSRDLRDQRLTRLGTFFAALRTQDTTRDDAEALGDRPLEQLVQLRRAAAAASRAVPERTYLSSSPPKLYAALEIQTADNWVNNTFPCAVAEMLFQALSPVRDPAVTSFPCALPSGLLVEGVIDRIMGRYAHKLWPDNAARPNDVTVILHRYILALMKSSMTSKDIGENAVQMLDSFLGVEDADVEEESSCVYEEANDHDGVECTLAHLAEHESCEQIFGSTAELSMHLVDVHEWDEEQADEVAHLHFG